ncbi:MAG: amidohydrolase family protein [Actinomycetota bacterium]|nr:amidohydrolase family protein [Actinomycetota bacterium]
MTGGLHLRGVLLPDEAERDVWVSAGRLTFEPVTGAETVAAAGWIVPGLVDAHCHVGLQADGVVDSLDVAREQARADRDAGALLLRDAGSPMDTRPLLDETDLPRLVRAGRHIARPQRYLRNYAEEVEPDRLVAEVRRQAAYGGGWVKLVGDWIDRELRDLAPLWPADVLTEAVRAAHQAGARVAVHTFGTEALADLIAAGVDCLEHGTGLTDDLIAAMVTRGTTLTSTTLVVGTFAEIADRAEAKFPTYAARMQAMRTSYPRVLRSAYEAGVPIHVGSDAGGVLPHGLVAQEIQGLAQAGIPAGQALAAGSWAARDWLGLPGIAEGAPADLVVYAGDPRADLEVLAEPARIVLRGRVVR